MTTLPRRRAESLAMISLRRTHLIEPLQNVLQTLNLRLVRLLLDLSILENVHDLLHLLEDMLKFEGDFADLFDGFRHDTMSRSGRGLRS